MAYRWSRFWMRFAGLNRSGRIATWLATWFAPPHYQRESLAYMHRHGYISPRATIYHSELHLGAKVFVDDDCMIYQNIDGGAVTLGDKSRIYRNTIVETGAGGHVTLGKNASIHPRCQLNAYLAPIEIGDDVMIAANCAFYSYDHSINPDTPIHKQPITSKGGIAIGKEAWLGTGVIVLCGVRIGKGAVIGAGSVVTKDIPEGAIAVGNPARVVKMRHEIGSENVSTDIIS